MMTYKGWRILAILKMPRAYNIKNVQENMNIIYGREVHFKDPHKPADFIPYMYIADKNDKILKAISLKGLKRLIEKEENDT